MKARITVMLKDKIFDPQGEAVRSALTSLGFREVRTVRQGKVIELELEGLSLSEARNKVEEMCGSLLINPVIETYHLDMDEGESPAAQKEEHKERG